MLLLLFFIVAAVFFKFQPRDELLTLGLQEPPSELEKTLWMIVLILRLQLWELHYAVCFKHTVPSWHNLLFSPSLLWSVAIFLPLTAVFQLKLMTEGCNLAVVHLSWYWKMNNSWSLSFWCCNVVVAVEFYRPGTCWASYSSNSQK